MVVVEEDNVQLDLDVPGNDGVDPEDAVTSDGVDIQPSDSFEVTPQVDTIRVMDVEFVVEGAATVTVTFTRPDDDDVVIEVGHIHQEYYKF